MLPTTVRTHVTQISLMLMEMVSAMSVIQMTVATVVVQAQSVNKSVD